MRTSKQISGKKLTLVNTAFVERLGEDGWTYIKTVVDVVREPVLILDANLRVLAANESFYNTFQVKAKETENKIVYELGNGQWDIPVLRKLLEDILPKHTFFKGFEVVHKFPSIGGKIMILNARQIYCKENSTLEPCPPIILLAIEDITEMMNVAQKLADHTTQFEKKVIEKTRELETHIESLEEEINKLKNVPV
jgi:nitrogen-specific signal transduction histidine kinase